MVSALRFLSATNRVKRIQNPFRLLAGTHQIQIPISFTDVKSDCERKKNCVGVLKASSRIFVYKTFGLELIF